jgi:hypothetical protein
MTTKGVNSLLPSAADVRQHIADVEARKASEFVRKQAKADAERKALLERFEKPSGVSDEERMKRAAAIIKRAMGDGRTEVEIGRFSNSLFTDRGRAINQQEPGWERTLMGLPKELHQFWKTHLQPLGYRLTVQIADWPNGMPGDIGITLSWAERKKS